MQPTERSIHRAPADQPTKVRQVAARLLDAYTLDGGTIHLAGCTLDDRLFARFDFASGESTIRLFVDRDGELLDEEFVRSLGMDHTIVLERPPDDVKERMQWLEKRADSLAREKWGTAATVRLQEKAAVWCKYASGKLRFTVGDSWADLPFGDWARTLRPPPFVCPYSGQKTFDIAATFDGRIVASSVIERCTETGRAMLAEDLITCDATGRRVAAELIETCPVTNQPVLRVEMIACRQCQQSVSPATIQRGLCAACRTLRPVSKADPRMARLLDEHPLLDQWGGWKISETRTVYILTAAGWFKRLLIVVDKESLELLHLATGSRMLAGWSEVTPEQYEYALRG